MPANNLTTGRDLTFVLVGPYGTVRLSQVTDYSVKRESSKISSKGLDGYTRRADIPDGWTISIKIDRSDATLDRLFARLDADYYAGVNIQGGTVVETIKELDGSVSQFRYEGVVLDFDGAGDFKGDSFVSQSLTLMAERRIQVA